MNSEVVEMIREAMQLSASIEEILDGEELLIILMALTKVSGVMLAEAKGMSPDLKDEESSTEWFKQAVIAAYRGHILVSAECENKVH